MATCEVHGVLAAWGRAVARRPIVTLVVAVVVLVASGVFAAGTMDRLVLSRFESPGSPSAAVESHLSEEFGTGKHHALLLVTAPDGVDDPPAADAAVALERELADEPAVAETASYWANKSPAMVSRDGTQALITMRLRGSVTEAREALADISSRFTRDAGPLSVRVGGGDEIFRQAATQARADFTRAELIVFPLVFVLLVVIYRRFSIAGLTLGLGVFSAVGALALIRVISYAVEVSTFAANLALVMGIGLGVDYSLFVISRFREEIAAGRTIPDAVTIATAQAGRIVAFSGLTVALCLACLLLFPFPFLQSFAYAGAATVNASIAAALFVLPAALTLIGKRVRPAHAASGQGRWHATATGMMRYPLRWGVPALLVVVLLASPALGLRLGLPDARVLPHGISSRAVQHEIENGFEMEQLDAIHVLVGAASEPEEAHDYALCLSQVPGIGQVDALTGRYAHGRQVRGPGPDSSRFVAAGRTWYAAIPTTTALLYPESLLKAVAEVPAPAEIRIGGYPADLVDFRAALQGAIPVVLGMILAVTFVLLFLMTGSLLLPLKAIVLNLLSLAIMFGVMVWGFQEGRLAGVLGFTPTGTLEATFPILMFCIAFGLSMDYEVFLISRIKEEYDRTGNNLTSVATGLQRSGPLVTAAAIILAASFLTYAFSGVVYLKILAVGMATVILIDATLIRAVLMPVFMRLARDANWWAPRSLRRLHTRLGLAE